MSARWVFVAVAALALAAGSGLWYATRPAVPGAPAARIAPAALYAAEFRDLQGAAQSLGQFQGRLLVLNFWATWCGPCREEMPAFERVHARWKNQGVAFIGVSAEDPALVAQFARGLGVTYPLWVGGDEVGELSRRLGNRLGVLPYTALIGPSGQLLEVKVGPYTEAHLEQRLSRFASKGG